MLPRRPPCRATLVLAALAVCACSLALLPPGVAARPARAPRPSPDAEPPGATSPDSLPSALARCGFENVSVSARDEALLVAYENRRLRTSSEAFARLAGVVPPPLHAFERRLGLVSAQIDTAHGRFWVSYPSDRDFPPPPDAPALSPTQWRTDLDVGPLVTYELGRVFNPIQIRLEIEPRLRLNPWPGALATASVILPVRDDFEPSPLEPDLDRVRPGPTSLEQFAWLPGVALLSASAGYFGDQRYGGSLGLARPVRQGELLFDAQADLTGFIAFPRTGITYSPARHLTGFGGVTWRPRIGGLDLALTARAARFLFGDQGVDFEARRTLGDLDIAYFVQRTDANSVYGVRLLIPVPPGHRAAGVPVRLQPVSYFPLEFRDTAALLGEFLHGVASRADHLRLLSAPSLDAHAREWRPAGASPRDGAGSPDWVSASGMTGFVNTPWAGVMADRGLEFGYASVPRAWAYDHRGTNGNESYYGTVGFLPRIETALRWTHVVGLKAFEAQVPDSRLPDLDRMASVRVELVTPRPGRPGLAVGMEDLEGNRRFHSSYAVAGMEFSHIPVRGRVALGYGFRALPAARRTLDGTFGALELSPWRRVATQIEYDSEKWNAGLGVALPLGFRARAALLNLESLSFGFGWSVAL